MSALYDALADATGPAMQVGHALAIFEATGNSGPLRQTLDHIGAAVDNAKLSLASLEHPANEATIHELRPREDAT